MINRAWTIYKDNESTFYDYRTNRKQSRILAKTIMIALVSVGTLVLPVLSKDALNSVITVQAILIGFSFSVMFFLVQNHKAEGVGDKKGVRDGPVDEVFLEDQIRQERLGLLSKELFWNISYFNMIAFSALVFALFLMIPNVWDSFDVIAQKLGPSATNFHAISVSSYFLAKWLFLLSLIESSHTFLRTVGRVNFLFEQRMGHGS